MIEKLKEKTEEIQRAKNTVLEPKKNLAILIAVAVCAGIVMGAVFYFTRNWEYLFCAVVVPIAIIGFGIYSFLKEKRQDKSSEKDKQEFLSGTKYRQKEWKSSYYQYKEKHTFETISKKGMVHDLKKRYRAKSFGFIRLGLLLTLGSILILLYSMTEVKDKVMALFGILCGGVIFSVGLNDCISGPVQKFLKQQTDLTEIEKSYEKGKMLSHEGNGINIGSSYTVVYTRNRIYAIDNNTIQDMTRKMVRVKQYENSLYSGQEYRYYISLIYTDSDGNTKSVDVRLDEFQCEMMIAVFNRSFYPEREYDSTTLEITENSVSP